MCQPPPVEHQLHDRPNGKSARRESAHAPRLLEKTESHDDYGGRNHCENEPNPNTALISDSQCEYVHD
jgi:hypothetical protein